MTAEFASRQDTGRVRVSVVIPAYNRRELLERTLAGYLEQSVPSGCYEILVVDDASSDDTGTYVQSLAGSAENLVYFRHADNQGQGAARNTGVRAARGD